MAINKKELKLIFVSPVGQNCNGLYEYDFFFSENIESVWGYGWDYDNPSSGADLPYENTYSEIKRLKINTELFCAQQNSCFSMSHCIDGCIALCLQSLDNLDAYPEPFRLVLDFGESYASVIDKLHQLNMNFIETNEEQ